MIHVILCDTDYKRYCELSRRKTISIKRCVNWFIVKSLIAKIDIQVIVINLELIPFEENILMQELKHFKGTVFCIGEPISNELKRRCKYIDSSISSKNFIDRLYNSVLEEKLTHAHTPKVLQTDPDIPLVGSSKEISIIKKQIRTYAKTNEPVLIVGETGTGKNIVARALHKVSNKIGEYHAVNCSAFSCQLFESEMFGHEKGAFTGAINRKTGFFEKSHRGSLFLDEIGDLPPTLQPKILKVIEEKTFYRVGGIKQLRSNSRIISATGLNLSKRISSGHFRIDLFYRISTLSIQLPPLRQRKDDIPELIYYFLSQHSVDKKFTQNSINLICEQNWPGNVRQLFGFLTRCLTHYPDNRILEIIPEDFSCLYNPFHTDTKTIGVSL